VVDLGKRIQEDLVISMKSRDEMRLGTLRMLKAALQLAQVEKGKGKELAEEEILAVVQRLIKQRREASEQYRAHGISDRADRELDEARILQGYMPEQLGDEELASMALEAAIQAGAKGPRDMGRVMGILMSKVKGRAEGGRVRAAVTQILEQGRL
jgi:uncharacterized protein YqeY